MTRVKYAQENEVSQRLAELGLTISELHTVARAAYIAKADCSPLHPPTYPGTAAWATAVLTLRDLKLPHKWRHDDPGNFSMTINDEREFYVVVATGDLLAGHPYGKEPTTKSPKGFKTEIAVAANRQMSLFPDPVPAEILAESELGNYRAWFLLLNIDETRVYIELSSPSEIARGKIVEWDERIVLPYLDLDPEGKVGMDKPPAFAPDVDVSVQRIA